jgi:hypothetical protein
MDSSNEFERQRASAQAVQMCMAAGIRFFDAAADVCGKGGKRVAELEEQLEDARRGGDELADALRRKDAVIEEYRKAERTRNRVCRPCESKRRIIAYLMGLMILVAWFIHYSPRHVPVKQTGFGALLSSLPLFALLIRWRVIQFKRKRHWVTWRDNDVFRAAAERWNGFLAKFVIEE